MSRHTVYIRDGELAELIRQSDSQHAVNTAWGMTGTPRVYVESMNDLWMIRVLKELRKPSAQEAFTRARMHRNEMATDLANVVLRHHLEGFIYPPIIQSQIDAYFQAVSRYRTAKDAL